MGTLSLFQFQLFSGAWAIWIDWQQ